MSDNSTVYIGTWINHSKGTFLGATLTLPNLHGLILISGLALFITFTSTRTWSILCFFVHQVGTTRRPRDGLYHQIQTTVRNNSSDLQSMWHLTKMAWRWGSPRSRSFQKIVGIIILALAHLAIFTILGLLSSRLITHGDEVLVRALSNCGSRDLTKNISDPDIDPSQAILDYSTHRTINAELTRQYVRDCYIGQQSSTECSSWKSTQLTYSTTRNASCPVSESMCLGPANGAVQFDTGLLDSCDDLGYVEDGKLVFDGQRYNYSVGYYGVTEAPSPDWRPDVGFSNATFFLGDPETQFDHAVVGSRILYNVNEITAYPIDGNSTILPCEGFIPIQELASVNQTLALLYVTFKGAYSAPSDDLWWPAHQLGSPFYTSLRGVANATRPTYTLDKTVNVLACTEQHQFCNPNHGQNKDKCAFRGLNDTGYFEGVLDNDRQISTAEVIMGAAAEAAFDILVPTFVEPPLLDSDQHGTTVAPGLADDNWIQESIHLFNMSLTTVQRYMVEWATGPAEPYSIYTYGPPSELDPLTKWQCENQIIRQSGYTSFSSLGLGLIFGLGGLVILSSLWLESIVGYFQKRFRFGLYQQVRWKLDSNLQLQRMAYEAAGLGEWKDGTHEIPVTVVRNQEFQIAMEWDEVHPSIKARADSDLSRTRMMGSELVFVDLKDNGADKRTLVE
ncbi:uncharacterized protein LY89DRAFT_777227 [Mollisia scopiformis]|uniref:Uncharacterized protein n=1 Tax=Mollisia scopiformis TaxID=149040 RepID=A0A194XTF0_MOLSC|nr:uncharacterized protein LY89DRAFT_777227 [Mollisia scopiformis]KUJ23483.1 hypothetical protein LY89DRAFT_777227 [Mollisia scopiformis]